MKILFLLLVLQGWQERQEQKNTALLRTVPQVEDLTLRAANFARKGNFSAALDIYDPVWKNYPNHVVPISKTLSMGVRHYIRKQISEWPDEGIAIYRKRYDPLLRELYRRARQTQDLDLLTKIATSYPFSSVAPDATLMRAGLLLDQGAPTEAARLLEPLLKNKRKPPSAVVAAKLGLAYSLSGDPVRLRSLLRESEQKWPKAAVIVGKETTPLVEYLKTLLKQPPSLPPSREPLAIPEWPMMSGTGNGNGTAEKNVPLGRQAWHLSISPPTYEFSNASRFRFQRQSQEHYLPLFPAVSDGIVYVHNEYSVYALPLFSNRVDLLWSFRQPTPPGILMYDDRLTHTTTVHNGRVYANLVTSLGQAEERLGYVRVKYPFPTRTLFALHAYTGKELWRIGGGEDRYSFSTAPTADGKRLYVGAVRQENKTDPFEHFLFCLDGASGAILWKTFIASGLTEINLFGNSTRESFGTPVSIQGDLLYYGTNHGVLAAVNRNTGKLEWIYRYRQLPILPTRSIQIQKNPLQWVNVPPVLAGGTVVFTPTDSRYLHVLDAESGRESWTARRRPDVRLLYGVQQKTVVVGGDTICFYDLQTGQLQDIFHPRSPGRGRGVLANGQIYLPTRTGLQRITLFTRNSSAFSRWKGNQSTGGNLVVVDGALLLAGAKSMEAYFDPRNFEREAEEILAKNPNHVGILYRSAVRFSQSGKNEKALLLFQKVLARCQGSGNPEELRLASACQLRLHRLHLRLGIEALGKGNRKEAGKHFRNSIKRSMDPQNRLKATKHLAGMLESSGNPAAAVASFQELHELSEDPLVTAEIRKKIATLIKRHGRSCYAKIERQAGEHLAQARKRDMPEALLGITSRFPNSLAAEQALLEAVDLFEKTDRDREQGIALRSFLREYPKSTAVSQVHVQLILFLEKRNQFSSALTLLSRLARLWPKQTVRIGEKEMTVKTFAQERMKRDGYQIVLDGSRSVPLKLPLTLALRHTEKGRGEGLLVHPEGIRPEKTRNSVFLRYRKLFLSISLDGNRWTISLEAPLLFTCFQEGELILATSTSIFRVNPETGEKLWTFSSPAPMRKFSLIGNQICFFTSDLRISSGSVLAAVDALEGGESWRQIFTGDPSSEIQQAGDLAIFVTRYPAVLYAYDSETGSGVLKKRVYPANTFREILQATAHQVILHSPYQFLEAWSLPEGKRMWTVNLEFFSSPIPIPTGKTVHIFAHRRGRNITLAARVDLETGKLDRLVEKPSLGDIQYVKAGKGPIFIVSLDRKKRDLLISGLNRDNLDTIWTVRFPESEGIPLPPTVVDNLLILARFSRGPNGAFSYKVTLLDQEGKTMQNMSSEFKYERPPGYLVEEGRVILTVDAEVRVYK